MSYTVLSVAYPFAQAGPAAVGGAEQILTGLERELVQCGIRSLVVAREGSVLCGRSFETKVPNAIITDEVREAVTKAHQANIDRALRSHHVDLIHMHGIDFHRYRVTPGVPVLVTLHLSPSWYPDEIWHLPANYHLQCVSETQRKSCPADARDRLSVITNGVPIPIVDRTAVRGEYALMLSRICPEKNLHVGFDAAREADVPVQLAGEAFAYEEHLRYLHEQIEPRLSVQAHLLGAVGGRVKETLLASARCLLLPTLAPETSSLVAMEALAAGTPVIAFPSGAISEIVEHNRTGFLVSSVTEMAAAIRRADEIDAAVCHAVAQSRYSLSRMVDDYRKLYDELLRSVARAKMPASPASSRPAILATKPSPASVMS